MLRHWASQLSVDIQAGNLALVESTVLCIDRSAVAGNKHKLLWASNSQYSQHNAEKKNNQGFCQNIEKPK